MPTSESYAEEVQRLRKTMRDLVAFSTLPAVWAGYTPEGIGKSLAEILLTTFSLDLVYIRIHGFGDVEVALHRGSKSDRDQIRVFAKALTPCLTASLHEIPTTIIDPLGGGELRIAVARFGHSGEDGVVVAGSHRSDFPTETDRLLLGVGTNQTAIVLQRKRAEMFLSEERERLRITVSSIGDAVISTDAEGRVRLLNGVAESLTGWTQAEAVGRPLPEVLHIVNQHTRQPVENPAIHALREGAIVGLANNTVLIAKDGNERLIDDSAAPMRSVSGATVGAVLVFRDVTEHKRAEESQAQLAAIVESSEDAILSKSLDGIIRSWNAGAQRLFGYTADEVVGRSIFILVPSDRHEEERTILERLRRGEHVNHFETVRVAKGGRLLDIALTVSPVRDTEGCIIGASKVARDITSKKQAEAELRDIRSRMEVALEAAAIGTWTWDIREDRFSADASLAKIFSVPLEHVAGGPIARVVDVIHPDDREKVTELVNRTVESGGSYEADYRVGQTNGSWRWVTARGQVERDQEGRAVRFPGVVIDVTDRKRAEEQLASVTEESERRKRLYETILSSTPDFVYVFSLDYRVLYANEALTAMWGYRLEDSVGKTFIDLGYEPWHAELHCREIDQVRATKKPIRGEVPFKGTNGLRIYDYIFVPVLGADGEVEAVAGTTRDITERQAMEQELRETDKKKNEFIALLAHELRNPLAPLRNGVQVLRLAGANEDAVAQARDMMERQLGHMVRLIDDLLDVSRISQNKMELRLSRVLLSDAVNSAVETARPAIDAAEHDLTISLPQRSVFVHADVTRLAQVFSNLLTNSARYTMKGGRIWLSADRHRDEVLVSVRDTGIGIPDGSLENIFDMFSQVDRGIERTTGGLGIGLALVKGLVEMHGGTVSAASEGEDKGSTFTVKLPILTDQPDPREAAPSDNAQTATGPRQRILVVDDNRDGADSLAMMLRLMGNEVRTANDGLEAIEQAEVFQPYAILMDVGMPRLNGLDATRRIRERPWGKNVIIVALTGWGQEEDRGRSRDAGCDGHLVKPVNAKDLQKLLGELQEKGRSKDL
jgi:PAS domain S-box-containing protein